MKRAAPCSRARAGHNAGHVRPRPFRRTPRPGAARNDAAHRLRDAGDDRRPGHRGEPRAAAARSRARAIRHALGHVARENPQWRQAGAGEVLAIFLGANAYVSPSWYPTKQKSGGRVVPTWNYVAVHAYGRIEFFDDAARLEALVTRLTVMHETGQPAPWSVSDAPRDYLAAMLKAIVGFSLPIARLEGKWKMSQNRPPEDRAGAAAALQCARRHRGRARRSGRRRSRARLTLPGAAAINPAAPHAIRRR